MYEDYMQNFLGENFYPYQNTYEQNWRDFGYFNQMDELYEMPQNIYSRSNYSSNFSINLEDLYPEIYKIVYPMIQKVCSKVSRTVDEDLIEEMTKEVYNNLETENIINLAVDSNNLNRSSSTASSRRESSTPTTNENRSGESRQFNPVRDLIKILLIRELLDGIRPPYSGPRPPMPPRPPFPGPNPRPPRPPFPGPSPRPPMPPRPRA